MLPLKGNKKVKEKTLEMWSEYQALERCLGVIKERQAELAKELWPPKKEDK